jgi:hypothetical protein
VVRTVAALAFIAAVGGGAVYLSQKKTVMKGTVVAADLLVQLKPHGITDVTCDDAVANPKGALFICRVAATDGSRATFEISMNRDGNYEPPKQLGDSSYDRGPDEAPPRERKQDPSADPWTQ